MNIHSAYLVSSKDSYRHCPDDQKLEVAFIGRSNVGKSSLINALLQRKQLAKVSKQPGKTQCINHYLVNNQIYFVDLPGYGWAKVSSATKIKWGKMLKNYLLYRTQLATVFLLIDAKIPLQAIDLACIRWLGENQIPFTIILTKADKAHKIQVQKHYKALQYSLSKEWGSLPPIFLISVHQKLGIQAILDYIQTLMTKCNLQPVC